jgi:hypothetical protein
MSSIALSGNSQLQPVAECRPGALSDRCSLRTHDLHSPDQVSEHFLILLKDRASALGRARLALVPVRQSLGR